MSNWRHAMPTPTAYRIDRVLYDIHHDEALLAAFVEDRDAFLSRHDLDPADHRAIRDDDIGAMYQAGANPYLLRAHCLGVGVPEDVFVSSLRAVGEDGRDG